MPRPSTALLVLFAALVLFVAPSARTASRPSVSPSTGKRHSPAATVLGDNTLLAIDDGVRLHHPRHTVDFTADGVHLTPQCGGPDWRWRFKRVGTEDRALVDADPSRIVPTRTNAGIVRYARDGLIEQYVARQNGVEQQFVIPRRIALQGADLIIDGAIECAGAFETFPDAWQWRTPQGVVTLSDVYVHDAHGTPLPATMTVTPDTTRIVVAGDALAQAAYPVTIDPLIGTTERISEMGMDGFTTVDGLIGQHSAIAYNPSANQYLVVWTGDDERVEFDALPQQVFGQLIAADTGAVVRDDFLISVGFGDADSLAVRVIDVVYNPNQDHFFVVWNWSLGSGFEIFGRRIATNGEGIDDQEFRISDRVDVDAFSPAVAHNSDADEYFVVWWSEHDADGRIDDETEIFGRFIDARSATAVGAGFRISDMAGTGASYPDIVFNTLNLDYLVVWEGDDIAPPPEIRRRSTDNVSTAGRESRRAGISQSA